MKHTITLPYAALLNANHRHHHHKKAELTRNLRTIGKHISPHLKTGHAGAHAIEWEFQWSDNRRRDTPNYSPTTKAILDGLVDGGVFTDDNDQHIPVQTFQNKPGKHPTKGTLCLTINIVPLLSGSPTIGYLSSPTLQETSTPPGSTNCSTGKP